MWQCHAVSIWDSSGSRSQIQDRVWRHNALYKAVNRKLQSGEREQPSNLYDREMGRKKRNNSQLGNGGGQPKRPKPETGETYLVKKYRPDKIYQSMEAFVRYTKAHRMLDASYVRWNTGVTPEKPFVFSTRVGGTDLGWGRGKTREAAMDCACRAAFALVNAHGYKNFTIDEDCLAEPPVDLPPPPPPPPPPPLPGMPPAAGMPLPPLPPGLPPPPPPPPGTYGLPPPPPPPTADIIPQPQLPVTAPVASSLSAAAPTQPHQVTPEPVSLQLAPKRKQIKGGLTLVFDAGAGEEGEEMCMEEMRASLLRYQKMLPSSP